MGTQGTPWPGCEEALVPSTHTPLTSAERRATPDPGEAGSPVLAVAQQVEENGSGPAVSVTTTYVVGCPEDELRLMSVKHLE